MAGRALSYAALLLAVQLPGGCSERNSTGITPSEQVRSAPASGTRPAPTGDTRLVLAFGDSLYAGFGLKPDESFPYELERALGHRGIDVRVHNAGVTGDTSAAGLQRLAFTLDGLPRKPDLAIVGLGANDMLRGLDPATTRRNLDHILSELRRREIPFMLTGMLAAPNLGRDYGARFNAIYPDLARKYDAALDPFFLDGVLTDPALMLPDRLHPNAAGIDVIVKRVTPLVAERLNDHSG
ncbi:MAG TPA: arylesterase [Allosphingosinicella sp.]|nr:arylesterase [Allosphingosinicella sp.]